MKKIGLLLVATSFLTGCLTLKTRSEVEGPEEVTEVQVEQQKAAEMESRNQVLETELRNLMGRVDELERKLDPESQGMGANAPITNKNIVEQMKIFDMEIQELKAQVSALSKGGAASQSRSKSIPKSDWTEAESKFTKKDWKNAVLLYQSYRDKNPKGTYYSMSTYKIGVCFQELKMLNEAKVFYQEVVSKFPKSKASRKAQYRLNHLK